MQKKQELETMTKKLAPLSLAMVAVLDTKPEASADTATAW